MRSMRFRETAPAEECVIKADELPWGASLIPRTLADSLLVLMKTSPPASSLTSEGLSLVYLLFQSCRTESKLCLCLPACSCWVVLDRLMFLLAACRIITQENPQKWTRQCRQTIVNGCPEQYYEETRNPMCFPLECSRFIPQNEWRPIGSVCSSFSCRWNTAACIKTNSSETLVHYQGPDKLSVTFGGGSCIQKAQLKQTCHMLTCPLTTGWGGGGSTD